MRFHARLVLVSIWVAVTCTASAPASSSVVEKCGIVGLHDLAASDKACVAPSAWPYAHPVTLEGRTVQYWNYNRPSTARPPKAESATVKRYAHFTIEVHRYADGNETVMISVSDACKVEAWDNSQVNLGCSSASFQAVPREDAAVLLPRAMVEALERNAISQGGHVAVFMFSVVRPDPIQPDGRPYTG